MMLLMEKAFSGENLISIRVSYSEVPYLFKKRNSMKLLKKIVIANVLGIFLIAGAIIGIVGGSMVICGVSAISLIIAGG